MKLRVARYGTSGTIFPFQDYLETAFKVAGVEGIAVDIPMSRALSAVNQGILADADPARAMDVIEKWPNLIAVAEPVYQLELRAFVRNGDVPVTGWNSLQGRRVIAYSGSVVLDRLLTDAGIANVIRADNFVVSAMMLGAQQGDVAILPNAEMLTALSGSNQNLIEASGPILASIPLYFALNKRFSALAPMLAEAFIRGKSASKCDPPA